MTLLASLATGHTDLADLLFLIAFIVFTLLALIAALSIKVDSRVTAFLLPAGLALIALGFFVL